MQRRSFVLAASFIFLTAGFSPALGQESPEEKVNRLMTQIYFLPNLPKLSPIKVRIDKHEKYSHAYYLRRPKRFFGLKTSKTPEIHISAEYVRRNSDDSVLVTLAHELGHHFDQEVVYLEPINSLERLIAEHMRSEKGQYFAYAFAIYILGENLFRKGLLDRQLVFYKELGAYWLYVETNPLLYKYYMDYAESEINYWIEGSKSMLDNITRLAENRP